ncbi:MAG: O-antigen ligase family protein [Burkholderiales bacterium]|nr:O-antigen ligase family protein [Burkholderiales bacterium]
MAIEPQLSAASASAAAPRRWPVRLGMGVTRATLWRVLRYAALLLFAALLGLSAVFLPWYFHLALLLALAYPVLVFKAPWVAFTLYVVSAFLAPGFKTADSLTLASLGLFALRWLQSGRPDLLPRALARPYLLFLFAVGVSGVLGLVINRYPIAMVYGDGRGFLYWLWLPLLFSLSRSTPEGLRKLSRVVAVVAGVIAFVALVQYATGVQFVAGRVGVVDGASGSQTRVQMHGFLFVSVATVWALVAVVHSPRRAWFLLPFLLLLLAALYANLGRALWFWTVLGMVLSVFAAGWRRGWAIALALTVVTVFGGVGLALFKPKVIDSIVERADSVRGEGGPRTSYGWRKLENQDALPHIIRKPLTGIGLGAEYRRWIHEVAHFEEHTRYVHNSYIFIALKTGLLSLFGLLSLLMVAWWRGWRGTRQMKVPQRALRVAAVASLFPLLGLSITQPELVTPMSALLFVMLTVLMGSCESHAQAVAAPARPRGVGV